MDVIVKVYECHVYTAIVGEGQVIAVQPIRLSYAPPKGDTVDGMTDAFFGYGDEKLCRSAIMPLAYAPDNTEWIGVDRAALTLGKEGVNGALAAKFLGLIESQSRHGVCRQ